MRYKIIILLCFWPVLGKCEEVDNDVVLSFVKMEERPVTILMPNICWKSYKLKSLTKRFCEAGLSFAYSMQPNRTEYFLQHVIVLTDMSCPGNDRFLMKASEAEYFKSPYRWLLLSTEDHQLSILQELPMLIDSDVVVAKKVDEKEYLFLEVYKITLTSEVIYTARASWRKSNPQNELQKHLKGPKNSTSLTLFESSKTKEETALALNGYGQIEDYRKSKVLSSRRNNVRQHFLTMANVITDSNETRKHLDDRLNLHQDSISKMSYTVVKICFDMLNATERLIFTPTWGYRDKNGNWQGVVDYLKKREADLGTLTIFTQERMEVIDYIAMIGSTAVRFVFREPPLALLSNIFTLPFTGTVWLAIFISVMGCALFIFLTSKWEASMSLHPLQLDGSWADVLILIIGAVLQQGCTLEPRYAAGRIVMIILFVAMTILYAAYSANIVVLLRAPSSSVRSLPDLLSSPLRLGASDFEYNRYFFKKLNEPVRKAIYNKKIAPKGKKPNFYTMEEGVAKIRQGLFAFHMELNPGYRLIQETYQEDEKCDLVEIDYINEIDPWVPGQKRAALKDLYKINFLKIRESGIQSCIHHRLHVPKPKCSGTISSFSSVGITDMYPAMIATLYGTLLAPAVLVLEICYKRLMVAREKRARLMLQKEEPDDSSLQIFFN